MALFATKSAHPLLDDAERAARLAALAGAPPLPGLRQAIGLLREVAGTDLMTPAQREAAVRLVDDAAQAHARFLGREFLTMAHLSDEEELGLWRANRDFWAQLGAAYYACMSEAQQSDEVPDGLRRVELARLVLRLMRAYAARLKWDQFRYWPASEVVWQIIGRAYLFADEKGFARREVAATHGERQLSTVEQEYLKALVFQVSSTDGLLPFEVEIAERLISSCLPWMSLSELPEAGCAYWVDAAEKRGPARITEGLPRVRTMRFIGTAGAVVKLEELQAALEQGTVPSQLGLARYRSPRILLPVVRHLSGYWASPPPERGHDRHPVRSQIAVQTGLANITKAIAQPEDMPRADAWIAENVSQGGMRARLPLGDRESLHIGCLLGIRPEGGENWLVGVVRRLAREDEHSAAAGIQTLSKHPLAVELGSADRMQPGLLLDAPDEGEAVRLIVPAHGFRPDETVECMVAGMQLSLSPVDLIERGVDFELVRYRVAPTALAFEDEAEHISP